MIQDEEKQHAMQQRDQILNQMSLELQEKTNRLGNIEKTLLPGGNLSHNRSMMSLGNKSRTHEHRLNHTFSGPENNLDMATVY